MGKRLTVAMVLLLLAILGVWFVNGSGDTSGTMAVAPSAVPSPSPTATWSGKVVVSDVKGSVERQGSGTTWVPLKPGDELSLDNAVRTGKDGSAVLDVGKDARVTIGAESQLAVSQITREVSRVRLESGRMDAVVLGDAKLKVETKGSDAVAEAGRGAFAVLADGEGTMSVAAQEGKVLVSALNRTVEVAAGEQSVVHADLPPAPPQKIPPSLFLKVGRPTSVAQRERETVVNGKTIPGALVSVNGVKVAVSETGEFSAPVALREGRNKVVVEVVDALGRKDRDELPEITVDSKVSEIRTGVTW